MRGVGVWLLLACLLVACASSAVAQDPSPEPGRESASPPPVAGEAMPATPGRVIEMEFADLWFQTRAGQYIRDIPVVPGESVTFRIENNLGYDLNFYIGWPERLSVPFAVTEVGIPAWSSGARELEWVVPEDPSVLVFGPTIPGFWPGMVGTFSEAAPDADLGWPQPEGVLDRAHGLSRATEERAAEIISRIRERTGATVGVYTQVIAHAEQPADISESDRIVAQLGTGPLGVFEDFAVVFDMTPSLCDGRAEVWAREPYARRRLPYEERLAIFETAMLPHLAECDLDAATLGALHELDAALKPPPIVFAEDARVAVPELGISLAFPEGWRIEHRPAASGELFRADDSLGERVLLPGCCGRVNSAGGRRVGLRHVERASRHRGPWSRDGRAPYRRGGAHRCSLGGRLGVVELLLHRRRAGRVDGVRR